MLISNLTISKPQSISGMVGIPNLTAMGAINPQMSSDITEFIYGIQSKQQTSYNFIKKYAKTKIVDGDIDERWALALPGAKAVALIECRISGTPVNSTDQIGVGGNTYQLVFPEQYFFENDVVASEAGPAFQHLFLDSGHSEGTNYVYEAKLQSQTDKSTYVPYQYMVGGKMFSRQYAPTEFSLGTKGAGFNYSTNILMQNQFMGLRYDDVIPGDVIRNKKCIKMDFYMQDEQDGHAVGKPKKYSVWELFAEQERKRTLMRAEAYAIWNARYNKDASGNIVDIGKNGIARPNMSGLEEQMYSGTKETFSVPTLAMFEEGILAVCDKRDFTTDAEIVMRTGYYGALYFRKLVKEEANSFRIIRSEQFTPKAGDGKTFELNTNFSAYELPNGATLKVVVDSSLDDTSIAYNHLMMGNGLPGTAFSYIYNIMNIGTQGG